MEKDMAERQFAFIPPEKVEYFGSVENGALFGISVHNNFLSASADIENSGNCLAADLNDAAAFHLLRVVEIGLRELARNLGIKKIAKAPLDYTGWESLVREINGKLEFKIPKVRGHKKSSALKFKQDLLADFSAFGVLRTEVMHGRSHHNEKQAIGLFERVREFMQRLDAQIFPVRKTSGVRSSKNLKKADSITKEAAERYADNLMRELAAKNLHENQNTV